ncbi:MAG: histidinol dehydrogenase [Thermaerobacterales bacterium]
MLASTKPFRPGGREPELPLYAARDYETRFLTGVQRQAVPDDVMKIAVDIVDQVKRRGDGALRELTARLDGVDLDNPLIDTGDCRQAWDELSDEDRSALMTAAERIETFHRRALPGGWLEPTAGGAWWGQVQRPIERVGIYVPGGRHPYPSSLLMCGIAARVAGVKELIVCTPPGPGGSVDPLVLAAAHRVGIDILVRAGGAQAVAAMAFGTERVPRCDKIVGPGNAFVTAAKQLVYGRVDVEGLMGPSELAVIADAAADPLWVAADLLAQAEHGPDTVTALFSSSETLIESVIAEVRTRGTVSPARAILAESLQSNGGAVLVRNLDEAIDLVNRLGPEHLQVAVEDPWPLVAKVKNAGAVYVGPWAPVALGDYAAGPNHVLPTGGTARFSAGLGVHEFLRPSTVYVGAADTFAQLAPAARRLAQKEGLFEHARSIAARLQPEDDQQ